MGQAGRAVIDGSAPARIEIDQADFAGPAAFPEHGSEGFGVWHGIVTRTEFGRTKIGKLSSGSGRGSGSPRLERFFSEKPERVAGCEMALDAEGVLDGGVNGQEALG
jgi:hypothetical protein